MKSLRVLKEFPFPSSGKAKADTSGAKSITPTTIMFQFPSNGNARSDIQPCKIASLKVSIPFKREGTFRHLCCPLSKPFGSVSIPFKREGTFRQFAKKQKCAAADIKFQFPSNGKAHSDFLFALTVKSENAEGFNSLQTGRHIQTLPLFLHLQKRVNMKVSIPFKREGTFRLCSILSPTAPPIKRIASR